jgi:hypothetical protein
MKSKKQDRVSAKYEQEPNGKKRFHVVVDGPLAIAMALVATLLAFVVAVDRGLIPPPSTNTKALPAQNNNTKSLPAQTQSKPHLPLTSISTF